MKELVHHFDGGLRKPVKHREPDELEKIMAEWGVGQNKKASAPSVRDDEVEDNEETDEFYDDSDWEWCEDEQSYFYVGKDNDDQSDSDSEPEDGHIVYLQSAATKGSSYLSITDNTGVKVGQHWTLNAGQKNEEFIKVKELGSI